MNQLANHKPPRMMAWLRGHARAMTEGVKMPLHTPTSSLFTVITLGICFYLPLVIWLLWLNFDEVESKWQKQGSIAVFLQKGLDAEAMTALQHDLNESALVDGVLVVDNETIRSGLADDPQLTQVLNLIESHELPDQVLLKPHPNATNEQLQSLAQNLQIRPEIDYVSFDADWFDQLKSVTQALFYLMQASIVVFMVIVLVFLSHSIGSEVAAHKHEIGLQKLLGASPAQIRRRFLYGGCYYGVVAALLALLLLQVTLWWLAGPIQSLSESFGQVVLLRSLKPNELLVFMALAMIITWMGARMTASSHIRKLS